MYVETIVKMWLVTNLINAKTPFIYAIIIGTKLAKINESKNEYRFLIIGVDNKKLESTYKNIPNKDFLIESCSNHITYECF